MRIELKRAEGNVEVIWSNPEPTFLLNGKEIKPISDKKGVNGINMSDTHVIIIQSELKWNGKDRTDFYGLELAKELRNKHKYKGAIAICSLMPFSLKYAEILKTPGIYYVQLPQHNVDLHQMKGIDEDLLADINYYLFDPEGAIHNLVHDIDNQLPIIAEQHSRSKENIKREVIEYLQYKLNSVSASIIETKRDDFKGFVSGIVRDTEQIIDDKDFAPIKLKSIIDTNRNKLYSYLPETLNENSQIQPKRKRWQVLYIDDQAHFCNLIKKQFERLKITCLTATTANKAFEILEKDEKEQQLISLIISDIRLYKDGDSEKAWQELQGYQILNEVASGVRFKSNYAYAVLTSKRGTINEKIKSKNAYLWFHKTDVLAGGDHSFNLFYNQIEGVVSDAFLRKRNIPTLGGWRRGITSKVDKEFNYSVLYKLHIEDPDYDNAEREINRKALGIAKKHELPTGDYVLEPSFLNMRKGGNYLLNQFRDTILLYRRVFLYLTLCENKNVSKAFKFFKPKYEARGELKDNVSNANNSKRNNLTDEQLKAKQKDEAAKNVFYTNWGLPITDEKTKDRIGSRKNYLLEEISFINSHKEEKPNLSNDYDDFEELNDLVFALKGWSLKDSISSSLEVIEENVKNATPIEKKVVETFFEQLKEYSKNNELREILKRSTLLTDNIEELNISSGLSDIIEEFKKAISL